ncbi:MAG: type II toxin-antitoxin system RelE/ParE family toxin [Nitrospirae bacterium]|jgi:phage-related protein|nr:type II toxin-antitoxin system RelE/ParE family toxin [Nitrospirota bacterium]
MRRTLVVFYKDRKGNVPALEWMDALPAKVQDKCVVKIERLRELGHALRRPEADLLRNGIYELRVGWEGMNYRILYFFYGQVAAVLAHGIVKEREVPAKDIERALERKRLFEQDPEGHTYREG